MDACFIHVHLSVIPSHQLSCCQLACQFISNTVKTFVGYLIASCWNVVSRPQNNNRTLTQWLLIIITRFSLKFRSPLTYFLYSFHTHTAGYIEKEQEPKMISVLVQTASVLLYKAMQYLTVDIYIHVREADDN